MFTYIVRMQTQYRLALHSIIRIGFILITNYPTMKKLHLNTNYVLDSIYYIDFQVLKHFNL